ncbi:hypothetical protein C8039_01835 [Halogeometricum sp. wsp3]|nr:hypothetical protein C8039_01835 [Halogeometricum sp. wsp3]
MFIRSETRSSCRFTQTSMRTDTESHEKIAEPTESKAPDLDDFTGYEDGESYVVCDKTNAYWIIGHRDPQRESLDDQVTNRYLPERNSGCRPTEDRI